MSLYCVFASNTGVNSLKCLKFWLKGSGPWLNRWKCWRGSAKRGQGKVMNGGGFRSLLVERLLCTSTGQAEIPQHARWPPAKVTDLQMQLTRWYRLSQSQFSCASSSGGTQMNGRAVRTELTRLNALTLFFSLCLKHSDVWHLLGVDRNRKQLKKKKNNLIFY